MSKINISPEQFDPKIFNFFNDWLLLTCGDFKQNDYNSMTVSWGFAGTMWNKPVVQVVVRPNRYTFEFMEKQNQFTISSFDENFKKTLGVLGSKSGRDIDKKNIEGLTPIASKNVASPSYAQSKITLECKVIYKNDLVPENISEKEIFKLYEKEPFHRVYFAEVVGVTIEQMD